MENEIWVPLTVLAAEEMYEISNTGKIKRLKDTIRSKAGTVLNITYHSKSKYAFVSILKPNKKTEGVYMHKLMAHTFIPNPENKKEINHINGDRSDFRLENLEWVTRSENMGHSFLRRGSKPNPIWKYKKFAIGTIQYIQRTKQFITAQELVDYLANPNNFLKTE